GPTGVWLANPLASSIASQDLPIPRAAKIKPRSPALSQSPTNGVLGAMFILEIAFSGHKDLSTVCSQSRILGFSSNGAEVSCIVHPSTLLRFRAQLSRG